MRSILKLSAFVVHVVLHAPESRWQNSQRNGFRPLSCLFQRLELGLGLLSELGCFVHDIVSFDTCPLRLLFHNRLECRAAFDPVLDCLWYIIFETILQDWYSVVDDIAECGYARRRHEGFNVSPVLGILTNVRGVILIIIALLGQVIISLEAFFELLWGLKLDAVGDLGWREDRKGGKENLHSDQGFLF